jgi:UrcA family protein
MDDRPPQGDPDSSIPSGGRGGPRLLGECAGPRQSRKRVQRIFNPSSSRNHTVVITPGHAGGILNVDFEKSGFTHWETHMNRNASIFSAKPYICLAALAAFAMLSVSAQADSGEVTVKISISTSGLDLRHPADAREVYRRLYFAARIACGNGNRVGLQSPASFVDCYEKALGEAVRSVNRPQLNIVYLATHTSRDAETYGIEIPARMAAK